MIPITKPLTGEDEIRLAAEVIRSGWLSQGPKTSAFEQAFAGTVGAKHAVAVSSCTTALHLAVLLSGLKPGDEAIVPSYTFVATANALLYAGVTPVFAEINPKTFNLDTANLERLLTPRTKAVLAADQFGLPAELDALEVFCRSRGLEFIEDAACALGAVYRKRLVGSRGKFVAFSLHPRKSITTGEGGVLVTDDPEIAREARLLRSHGASVSDLERHGSRGTISESYIRLGYNYRLSDVHSAIGLAQLPRLEGITRRRRELAGRYSERLGALGWIEPPYVPKDTLHPFQTYAVLIKPDSPVKRDNLIKHLADRDISSRSGIPPIHRQPYMARRLKSAPHLPITDDISARTLMLPLYPQMTQTEQDQVIEAVKSAETAGQKG